MSFPPPKASVGMSRASAKHAFIVFTIVTRNSFIDAGDSLIVDGSRDWMEDFFTQSETAVSMVVIFPDKVSAIPSSTAVLDFTALMTASVSSFWFFSVRRTNATDAG